MTMLLEDFFETHYKKRRLLQKSHETVRLYRFSIRSFGKTVGKRPTLKDLTLDNLVDHMQRVLDDGRSAATANKDRAQILALWRFAFRLKMHEDWPEIPELTEPERVPEAWLDNEFKRLLAAARQMPGDFNGVPRSVWWEAMLLIALDSGERCGAIRPAKWSWLNGDWITMPAEVRKGKRRDHSYRLSQGTLAKLSELQKWCGDRREMFPWPYSYSYFWTLYGKVLKQAGLPNGRKHKMHKIRKTTASVVDAAGMDAQRALDHSSKEITKLYLDPRFRRSDQPCDVLAAYLANPGQRNTDPPSQATG